MVDGGFDPPGGLAGRRAAPRRCGGADPEMLAVAATVLAGVRRAKSEAKTSMKAVVASAVVVDTEARIGALQLVHRDLCDAGIISSLVGEVGEPALRVELEPPAN